MNSKKIGQELLKSYIDKRAILCVDVGAKGGVFRLNKIEKYCSYYGFEPNTAEFHKLKETNTIKYLPYGLSEAGGEKEFFITRHASYSSLLKCNFESYQKHFGKVKGYQDWSKGMDILKTVLIKTKTLDSFILEQNIDTIDFLKLDTQGTELSLLKGGSKSLDNKQISVIFAEVTFVEVYRNQNLFSALDLYLKSKDYEFVDCRFYPDGVRNSFFEEKEYEASRFSVGGDAIYVPKLETIKGNGLQCFKIGVILSSMRYLSMSNMYLKQCNLSDNQIKSIHGFLYKKQYKKSIKNIIPPLLLKILKRIFNT